jgi:Spy/CpxP family protein refolding chaperone
MLVLVLAALAACTAQPAPESTATPVPTSPYVSLLDSPIRGLSPEEIQELETGAGAGFARAAELNGYPGPRHILDLHEQLDLSQDQLNRVQGLYDAMNAEARQLGAEILQLEADLELDFRNQTVDEASLEAQVTELADKYGALRLLHLRMHLAAIEILTPHQLMLYNQLRGYTETNSAGHDHAHQ